MVVAVMQKGVYSSYTQVNRFAAPASMDKAWQACVRKLQVHGGPGNPAPPADVSRNFAFVS
jgi:hypothetical protein